jgi:hypothetical protein
MPAFLSLISLVLPPLVKILGFVIDRKKDSDLRTEFLKFVTAIEKDVSVNLNKSYRDQILHIKEELRLEDVARSTLAEEHLNYKTAYEKLELEYKQLENSFKELTVARSQPARRRGRPKNQNKSSDIESTNQN